MITLRQLELHNFLSHVDTALNFEDYNGLVLIEGMNQDGHYSSNGSGKSTLLEGIVYALTGDTLRGVGVNDVVNRNKKKDTRVVLRFTKDDVPYEIIRHRKHSEFGDSIVFIKDGTDISKRVNKETQQLIDDTIGISFKILVSTILLGEGLSSRFTQLSDPEKKNLIESTLNLNYDVNALRAKANARLTALKLEISNLEGRINSLEECSGYDVEKAGEELKVSKEEYINTEKEYAQLSQLVEVKNNAIGIANQECMKIQDKMNLVKSSIDKIDYLNNNLSMLDAQNLQLISELENVAKCENPRCTVCHQELKDEASNEAFKNNYMEKIKATSDKMAEFKSQLDALPDRSILTQSYDRFSLNLVEAKNQVDALTQESRNLNDAVHKLINKTQELNYRIKTIETAIDSYKEAHSNIAALKEDLSSKVRQSNIYDYFYKLFSPTGIIVDILAEAVEYINDRIRTYSEVLLDKRYHIDFKKGKISLVDDSGASYQSLSNGEKRRLDISIQFALHDYVHMYCGMKMNCCYIDEVLDTLDDIGVENIFDVLRLKLEYCGLSSIYVITHNDNLKSKFDHIITVVKNKDGDSHI